MRAGKLQVTVNFGSGSTNVKTYDMVEIDFGNEVVVGYSQMGAVSPSVTWKYELDVSDSTQLDATFNQMGTNSYVWVEPMEEVAHGGTPQGDKYTPLTNGMNLNNCTAYGTYFKSASTSTSFSIVNEPDDAKGTYVLEVLPGGANGQILQRITMCLKGIVDIYTRAYYANAWGVWSRSVNGQKVLWSGAYWMQGSHNIPLSEKVTEQDAGITLIWSPYVNGAPVDVNFNLQFIPKYFAASMSGKYITHVLTNTKFGAISSKSISVYNDHLTGFDTNKDVGTANGVTYDNTKFVLRYVIGC